MDNDSTFTEQYMRGIVYVTAPNIWAKHAFTTRLGGVSSGIFSTLNLGLDLGDNIDSVKENYRLLANVLKMNTDDFVRSKQVHGFNIRIATTAHRGALFEAAEFEADGMVTCDRNVALTVYAADCVPILLHDPIRGAIGAVHAGWRGTVANIAAASVRKMTQTYGCQPDGIKAAIGPSIGKCCYEVGQEVIDMLQNTMGSAAGSCYTARGSKYMLDLKEANRIMLTEAGLQDISVSDVCTSCNSTKYWSHRAMSGMRGSQCAFISL